MYYNKVDVDGIKQVDKNSFNLTRKDRLYCLIYLLDGDVCITINSKMIELQKGEVFVIYPDDDVSFSTGKCSPALRILQVLFRVCDPNLDSVIKSYCQIRGYKGETTRNTILEILNNFTLKPPLYQDKINLCTANLILEITRYKIIQENKQPGIENMFSSQPQYSYSMNKITEYINANIDKTITIKMLADYIKSTPSYVCKLFKSEMNTTPLQYINTVRINRAKELLIRTEKPISEVAIDAGFKSLHYFSRYFKEKEKINPLRFKAQFTKYVFCGLTTM